MHISTIRRWIREGKLPAYRVGDKGVRVRYSDVMRLLAPLPAGQKDEGLASNQLPVPGHPGDEERRRALAAVARARTLQKEFRAKYGVMAPESWELLNESRDTRARSLAPAAEE